MGRAVRLCGFASNVQGWQPSRALDQGTSPARESPLAHSSDCTAATQGTTAAAPVLPHCSSSLLRPVATRCSCMRISTCDYPTRCHRPESTDELHPRAVAPSEPPLSAATPTQLGRDFRGSDTYGEGILHVLVAMQIAGNGRGWGGGSDWMLSSGSESWRKHLHAAKAAERQV